jgi:hypothetical protein
MAVSSVQKFASFLLLVGNFVLNFNFVYSKFRNIISRASNFNFFAIFSNLHQNDYQKIPKEKENSRKAFLL